MERKEITVLLVEDNESFAKLVKLFLQKYDDTPFHVIWKVDGRAALEEVKQNQAIDVIIMDYFLPGQNGLEVTRQLREKKVNIPVVFLTVNKDFYSALEAMKLGVGDYLVKDEVSTPVLPRTLINVLEKVELKRKLDELEISQKRLEAMQELAFSITQEIDTPIMALKASIERLEQHPLDPEVKKFLGTMKSQLERIEQKSQRLKNLREDKTIPYIKDIRMVDLSS